MKWNGDGEEASDWKGGKKWGKKWWGRGMSGGKYLDRKGEGGVKGVRCKGERVV